MDLLKDAINTKKSENDSLKKDKTKKWVKRGDIEEEKKRRYLEEQEKEKEENEKKKRKFEIDTRVDESLIQKPKLLTKEEQLEYENNENIKKKLRQLKQPITHFGETNKEREERLKFIELNGIPKEIIIEKFIYPTIEEVEKTKEKEIFLEIDATSFPAQSEDDKESEYIHKIFILIMQYWEKKVKSLTPQEINTREGKLMINIFNETKNDIKSFLDLLLKDRLPADIFSSCLKIVNFIQQKEYLQANDSYLDLAIGNAPWPLGVTATGIHERAGRERIETKRIKSLLNDDDQRKYLQAVKRLITMSQKIFPTDPSKMI
jgi:hypothetical protein